HGFERHRSYRELDRVPERAVEVAVVPKSPVVVETDVLLGFGTSEAGVGETEPECLKEGVDGHEQDDEDARGHEIPGEAFTGSRPAACRGVVGTRPCLRRLRDGSADDLLAHFTSQSLTASRRKYAFPAAGEPASRAEGVLP